MKSKIEGAKRQTHQTSYSAFGKIILGPAKTPQLWRGTTSHQGRVVLSFQYIQPNST